MSFGTCQHHCANYGECWPIIWALKAYERRHDKKHDIERLFFSGRSMPYCHKPLPPQKRESDLSAS